MTYEETIEYLYNSVPMFQKVGAVAYKEGLHNTLELDRHFGHPHQNFKTIHIAGTKRKRLMLSHDSLNIAVCRI